MLVVDLCEWCALAKRLRLANQERLDELLDALRRIVEAEEFRAAVSALTSTPKPGRE